MGLSRLQTLREEIPMKAAFLLQMIASGEGPTG